MTKHASDLKILLLQIRDQPRVRIEELESFAQFSGLNQSQIDCLNVFDTPNFPASVVDQYDGLYVGGASEASVLEPDSYAFIQPAVDLLLHCIDKEIPVFASCFGFQLAVIALGGKIIRDKRDFEMGTIPIYLSKSSQQDPLYRDTENHFMAVAVHRERCLETPRDCELLAYTDNCCHSFRVKDKPFWTFQFHPEVDKRILVERLTIFKDHYTESQEHLAMVLSQASETPESNLLLKKFVDRVLCHHIKSSGIL